VIFWFTLPQPELPSKAQVRMLLFERQAIFKAVYILKLLFTFLCLKEQKQLSEGAWDPHGKKPDLS